MSTARTRSGPALGGAYRVVLYPFIALVVAAGFMTGRWLETSGILHEILEGGGTAVGVPEQVFREGPGQPRTGEAAPTDDTPEDAPDETPDDVDVDVPDDEPTPDPDLDETDEEPEPTPTPDDDDETDEEDTEDA